MLISTCPLSFYYSMNPWFFSIIIYTSGLISSGDYVLCGDENGDLNLLDLYTLRVSNNNSI